MPSAEVRATAKGIWQRNRRSKGKKVVEEKDKLGREREISRSARRRWSSRAEQTQNSMAAESTATAAMRMMQGFRLDGIFEGCLVQLLLSKEGLLKS